MGACRENNEINGLDLAETSRPYQVSRIEIAIIDHDPVPSDFRYSLRVAYYADADTGMKEPARHKTS